MAKIVDFPNSRRIHSVGGNQIIWIDALKIADSQRSVFEDRDKRPPGAAVQALTQINVFDIT